ncbi:unnamed protein product [Schistosoma mattheei]|uniref:Uncharacterized protein n=1 Tax=Schistosoma mattheei TaxID=31246 RepID=A0A3P8I3V3_9TREM|nr:unnamed protein product [Schistosoma mattheei]
MDTSSASSRIFSSSSLLKYSSSSNSSSRPTLGSSESLDSSHGWLGSIGRFRAPFLLPFGRPRLLLCLRASELFAVTEVLSSSFSIFS